MPMKVLLCTTYVIYSTVGLLDMPQLVAPVCGMPRLNMSLKHDAIDDFKPATEPGRPKVGCGWVWSAEGATHGLI